MFAPARRNLISLLLIPALLVKTAAMGCPHGHEHEPVGHATIVHFHWGPHDHHHGHDHGSVPDHSLPPSHPESKESHSQAQATPGNRQSSGPCHVDPDARFADSMHDCNMIVLGAKIDLHSQPVEAFKRVSTEGPESTLHWPPSEGTDAQWARLKTDCQTRLGGQTPDRADNRLYRCAPAPLFLQLLCLRI